MFGFNFFSGRFKKKSYPKILKPKKPRKPKPEGFAAMAMNVLKEICRSNNLPTTGKKEDLVKRLVDAKVDPNQVRDTPLKNAYTAFFGFETAQAPKYIGASAPEWDDCNGDTDSLVSERHFTDAQQAALQEIEDLYLTDSQAAIFEHQGEIPMVPQIRIKATGQEFKTWPLSDPEADALAKSGTDAPFGQGTLTVTDKNVRSCRQLSPDQFDILNDNFKNYFSDSTQCPDLEDIRKKLAPNTTKISAQLYKLLVYPQGGFFAPHVDTLRDPNMFGTLVVELPGDYYGGHLEVEHHLGRTVSFYGGRSYVTYSGSGKSAAIVNWEKHAPPKSTKSKFIAFYTDLKHQIKPVVKGYRITLVYNLYRSGTPVQVPPQTFGDKVVNAHRKLFAGPAPLVPRPYSYGRTPDAATGERCKTFAILQVLEHTYGLSTIKPSNLKGRDAEYYTALANSGEFDVLLLPIGIEESGVGGCGDERGAQWAERLLAESNDSLFVETFPIDTSSPTKGSGKQVSYPTFAAQSFEKSGVFVMLANGHKGRKAAADVNPSGNEGTGAALLYVNAALCIKKRDPARPFVDPLSAPKKKSKATPAKVKAVKKVASVKELSEEEEDEEELFDDESDDDDDDEDERAIDTTRSSLSAAAASTISQARQRRENAGKRKLSDMIAFEDDSAEQEEDEDAGGAVSPSKRAKHA